MTNFQLHIKPCPYCNHSASIERALYYPDGTQIPKDAPHDMWLAKCSECGARTEYMPTRLSAIFAWNRGQFNGLTHIMHSDIRTPDMDIWYHLRDEIIIARTQRLEEEALAREIQKHRGVRVNSKLKSEWWFYTDGYKKLMGPDGDVIVNGIKSKAPYDYWKYQMDCRHCAIKEGKCPHKADNSLWRRFIRGTAPGCPKREGDYCI